MMASGMGWKKAVLFEKAFSLTLGETANQGGIRMVSPGFCKIQVASVRDVARGLQYVILWFQIALHAAVVALQKVVGAFQC